MERKSWDGREEVQRKGDQARQRWDHIEGDELREEARVLARERERESKDARGRLWCEKEVSREIGEESKRDRAETRERDEKRKKARQRERRGE
ncbi:hypothetical protein chiPu_0022477 [Chiloscyllium punctatum]|uniref:Uncharacterized protein n=1 Tax=Chiloscyllium punctatum TaxID=137246 RepID=A0A401RGR9_CHIPU|nr:hypothetical protein [Chiloscyllium punctatum]